MTCPGAYLSACDLSRVITTVTSSFPDTCTVQTITKTANGYGGWTETVSVSTVTPCRVQARFGKLARDVEASGLQKQEFHVFLPATTVITVRDRILWKTRVLRVVGIAAPETEQTFLDCFCAEVI